MYKILTKASINQITGFHRCASIWGLFANLPRSSCPNRSNIKYLHQTQVGCVTNVVSYSLYECTYVAGMRDISEIVCYHQVLFAAVTKLQQFEEKTTNIFAASGFHKIANIHVYSTVHLRIRYWKITRAYRVFPVGLVNLPHSSTCPRFPYDGILYTSHDHAVFIWTGPARH